MSCITPATTLRQRQPRVVDSGYKGWIAGLPCAICAGTPVEVAHLRYADALYLKEQPGMQAKPDDIWTLPLCPKHHRLGSNAQHSGNERLWWRAYSGPYSHSERDPHALCLILRHLCHPDTLAAERVLEQWRSA